MMCPRLAARAIAILICFLGAAAAHGAEVIHNTDPEFTIVIPDGFVAEPRILASDPSFLHAFRRASDDGVGVAVVIEKMKGMLGRERLDMKKAPAGFKGKILLVPWNDFELEMFEVPEETSGVKIITYNVQVPLRRAAVQVKVMGLAKNSEELRTIMGSLLGSLTGETNWIKSALPESFAASRLYTVGVLAVLVLVVIGGVAAMWFAGSRLPRGATLAIGIGLVVLGMQLPHGGVREMRLLSGSVSLLGTALCILGVVQVFRRRGKA